MSRWLRSDRVRTLFLCSSWAVVCMGIFLIFMLTPWFLQIEALPRGEIILRVLGGTLGAVGVPASLVIWFGMMVFCAREDSSSIRIRIFWFVVFFTVAWFGSAAYFFKVYRKQVQQEGVPASA